MPDTVLRRRASDRPNITSLQSHILAGEASSPGSTGDFTWILSALSLAAKAIAHKVRVARIEDVLGDHGGANVHGETQQKLDVIANEILMTCLGNRPSIAVVASEEDDQPTLLRREADGGKYCVIFDPLDGSSNLDVGVGVGTIFSILRNDPTIPDPVTTLCQPGSRQVAAGYVLYGSSTVFVLTTGRGVDMFVLNPEIGSFVLVKSQIRIPATGRIYSVNEGNRRTFPAGFSTYLDWAQEQGYSSRYIGSMVADVHRTLLKGGVFLYPPTKKNPEGKLRLMYEANPIAMLMEQAGGKGVTADGTRILDVQPTSVHQRTSVILGSSDEVDAVTKHLT
ncbi:MAG TPA: class 1 fructose-bisphosphatase [Vicinamibacterales bacterium]|nr:class 1 fructose-bisphosphatase [Vicinamibacterales bacterium]